MRTASTRPTTNKSGRCREIPPQPADQTGTNFSDDSERFIRKFNSVVFLRGEIGDRYCLYPPNCTRKPSGSATSDAPVSFRPRRLTSAK